jgi:hypothetical protein
MRTAGPNLRRIVEKVIWILTSYLIWELEHRVIHDTIQRISG